MRRCALALAMMVAGCGGSGSTSVTTSSVPPDNGAGSGGGAGGGNGGGGMPGGGGGTPGGGGGGSGGLGGGGGSGGGGAGGGGGGGSGGGAMIPPCTSQPSLVARLLYHPAGLAVDDATVYASAHHADTTSYDSPVDIWAIPLDGEAPRVLGTAVGGNLMAQMTVNSTAVFYDRDTRVIRIAKDGSGTTQLATDGFGAALADAGGYIWWTDSWGVFRAPEDGGPTMQATDTKVTPTAIAFDATDLFAAGDGDVWRVPGRVGAPLLLHEFDDGSNPEAIAADDHALYVGTGSSIVGGYLWSLDKSGAFPPHALVHYGRYIVEMFADAGTIYWWGTADTTAYIGRVGTDGSNFKILAERPFEITGFAVRGDSVYFSTDSDGGVYRMCK
jgi:hypothetical protein